MHKPQPALTHSLTLAYRLSLGPAVLMAAASLAGLLFPQILYPTEQIRRSFISNDVVNLFIGLPILLGSLWLARRGSLIGLLLWPGALFFATYNYLAYAIALPLTIQFLVYIALVALSAYAIFRLLSSLDLGAVRQRLTGVVHERTAGGVLAIFGALFFLRGVAQLAQGSVSGPELAVTLADLLITPFWVAGGVALWRRRALGYACGLGLLFQGSMLFVGLLAFFILQPILSAVPFPLEDFIVIAGMGLVFFVPFGLFLRGVVLRN
ncbi:MAG: hypothetical protein JXB15_07885 [Anaerolineales bacterium]|nr:hypothetical protein [Anaerolineales bacterium]